MDAFKIDIFKKENPGVELFEIQSLTVPDAERVRARLRKLLKIKDDADILRCLGSQPNTSVCSVLDAGFSMETELKKLRICDEYIYINWDDFSLIDKVGVNDFCRWFEYIWYPASDDIDIFNDDLTWFLHVYHCGTLAITRLDSTCDEAESCQIRRTRQ
jgi:hypothetical protein